MNTMPPQACAQPVARAVPIALQSKLLGIRVPPAYFPSPDLFQTGFSSAHLRRAIWMRSAGRSHLGGSDPLALDIQIPLREWPVASLGQEHASPQVDAVGMAQYLDAVQAELALHAEMLPPGQGISNLSLGGAGLHSLSDTQLEALVQGVRRHFHLIPRAEMTLRFGVCDLEPERAVTFQRLGFTKVVRAVEDFDSFVQYATGRAQSADMLAAWVAAAHQAGVRDIQFEMTHGLPLQTCDSMRRTLDHLLLMQPQSVRLVAHVSDEKPNGQSGRGSVAGYLPVLEERTAMWSAALALLVAKGFVHLGGDHFTMARSPLDMARRAGRLEHDFHGYTAAAAADVIGVGLGAISRVGVAYSRNTGFLGSYEAALGRGEFPVFSGLVLDQDALARRAVIHALVCEGHLDFARISALQRLDFHAYFAAELQSLRVLANCGLVTLGENTLELTAVGRYFLGSVVAVFHPASRSTVAELAQISSLGEGAGVAQAGKRTAAQR